MVSRSVLSQSVLFCGAGLICAAPAQAQAQAQQDPFSLCRQVKNDTDRLKCFDAAALLMEALGEKLDKPPEGPPEWSLKEEVSPLDDTLSVAAMLRTTQGDGAFLVRCRDKKTEAYVMPKTLTPTGSNNTVRVAYRIGKAPAVTARWPLSMDGRAVFIPTAVPLLKSLVDNEKFFVRVWDRQNATHDALFNIGNMNAVRTKLSDTCQWNAPPPRAPAPPAAPSATPEPGQQGAARLDPVVRR